MPTLCVFIFLAYIYILILFISINHNFQTFHRDISIWIKDPNEIQSEINNYDSEAWGPKIV